MDNKLPKIPQAPNHNRLRVRYKKDTLAFYDVIIITVVILALGLSIFATQFSRVEVSGPSMEPTLFNGQVLLMRQPNNVRRGDIVVYHSNPNVPHTMPCDYDWIKRVVAVGGDTVRFVEEGGVVFLYLRRHGQDNFERVREDFINAPMNPATGGDFFVGSGDTFVPHGHYFVLGDNRNRSSDSRGHGPIARGDIVARVVHIPRQGGVIARILAWLGE